MSVDTTLAVLYAQSGLSTNVANAAMVAPQASLAMTRVLAAEEARQQRYKIEKNEKTEESRINKDGGQRFSLAARLKRRKIGKAAEGDNTLATTPFSGNLLNVKV